VKLAVLGGGGFRTPLVYGALLAAQERLGLEEVWLHDVDETRLERVGRVLEGLAAERGATLPFRATTNLEQAVEDASFVFCAIRVGGLQGRVVDEAVPLHEGVLGQETTGPGGICFALRTVPVMVEIAETVARKAPHAWFINFTNPAGLVTEAIQQVLGHRAIGICDTPSGLCRRVAAALGRPADELWFDYLGLNHLGWLRGVHDADGDLLPGLLADDRTLASFEEGALFGGDWLRTLGMIPNEYLAYYYYATDTVGSIRTRNQTRAEYLLEQQTAFYGGNGQPPQEALEEWRASRRQRDGSYMAEAKQAAEAAVEERAEDDSEGYEGVAMAVVDAIARNTRTVLILNVANRSALPFLDERAVVEVPCLVGAAGAVPVAAGDPPPHARALMGAIKDVERTTIEAALTGSRQLAVKALALHPLVQSTRTARRIFDAYVERQPALEGRFR
jgi:6-phospho-beta-glucosidase